MNEALTEIHLLQSGQQVGPFPPDAVRAMISAGTVAPDDLAWAPGLPEWVPVSALLPDAEPPARPSIANVRPVVFAASKSDQGSFLVQLLGSFAYPFHGDGLIILIAGTIFFAILDFLRAYAGLISLFLTVASVGYYFATLQAVIQSTAHGENKLPKWPDFGDWKSELLEPFFQWLGTLVVCFAPAVLVLIFSGVTAALGAGQLPSLEAFIPAGVLLMAGLVYFPMALLAVAMFDSLTALNPLLIVRSMVAAPVHYLLLAIFLGGLFATNSFVRYTAGQIQVPVVGALIASFVSLYASLLFARSLGLFYRINKERLGWF